MNYFRCSILISADMTKALVFIMNSRERHFSRILKLFGDPDEYVHQLTDDTHADQLLIHMEQLYFGAYNYLHYVAVDYNQQMVYFSNNFHGRIEYGLFIYHNLTYSQTIPNFGPVSLQVPFNI